jgi:cation:H+ antiporter
MWLSVAILIISLVVLTKAADYFVDYAVALANIFKISPMVIGLTIVAMGTSAPEFAVSVTAALKGQGDLSFANVVGSNIFNLGIILGLASMFATIPVTRKTIYRDSAFLLAACIFLLVATQDNELSTLDGLMLLGALFAYLTYLFKTEKSDVPDEIGVVKMSLTKSITGFVLSLAALILSSRFLVSSAVDIAQNLGIQEWVIGVTIIAAGTSMPELVTTLTSIRKGRVDLGVGNLVGSDIFNVVGVMGVAALASEVKFQSAIFGPLLAMTGMVALLIVMMRFGMRITRTKGIVLLFIALARWIMDIRGGWDGLTLF